MKMYSKVFILLIISNFLIACDSGAMKKNLQLQWMPEVVRKPASEISDKTPKYSTLVPTTYYIPTINLNENKCEKDEKVKMRDHAGKVLASLCHEEYKNCLLQGTCILKDMDKQKHISVAGKNASGYEFYIQDIDKCKYGKGSQGACLDPFYSIAADMNYYNYGDVIYVPEVRGLKLPNGDIHPGYFIVRDEGGAIKGKNRFDFFTGNKDPYDAENILARIGLADRNSKMHFIKLDENKAEAVRKKRNFPLIPTEENN